MRDFDAFKTTAVRYWERRRIIYNAVLMLPAGLAYMMCAGMARVGDDCRWHPAYVVLLFALSAIGANICYSFAYTLEFLFGSDDPSSRWVRFERPAAFVAGVLISIVLAFIGGRNIALMEFFYTATSSEY